MPKARRSALLSVALAVPALFLGGTSAVADAPEVPYSCLVPALSDKPYDIDFSLATDAPTRMYAAASAKPVLTIKVTIPGNIMGLASVFGVDSATADGTYVLGVNGVPKPLAAKLPKTKIPAQNTPYDFTIKIPMPVLKPAGAGTTTYTPGPLKARVELYKKDGSSFGGADVSCVVKEGSAPQKIDTVTSVKSATRAADAAAYTKKTKKLRVTTATAATSGVKPTGRVVTTLYKGSTRIGALTGTLVNGRAAVTFNGKKSRGTYKVVTTYGGSGAHLATTTTKAFVIK